MTVKELKERLKGVADDSPVLIGHGYALSQTTSANAEKCLYYHGDFRNGWFYSDNLNPYQEPVQKVVAFVVW